MVVAVVVEVVVAVVVAGGGVVVVNARGGDQRGVNTPCDTVRVILHCLRAQPHPLRK